MNEQQPGGEIILYQQDDGSPALKVKLQDETVWLSQQQLAELFQTTRANVTMHLGNVYAEGELDRAATSKDFLQVRQEGGRTVRRRVTHYNLDAIISLGYRIKSTVATRFRIWATQRIKDYLVKGYAINQQRLEQLGQVVRVLGRSADPIAAGLSDVLASYLPGLQLLREYDEGQFPAVPGATPNWTLTIDEARSIISRLKRQFPQDHLLGQEHGDSLEAIIGAIYQGFGDHDLYPTVEQKAANLLYLVIKDHPLSDGNKRTAAALFVTFLSRNGLLLDADGHAIVSNNALTALTLLVATSAPQEKELMIGLIMRMLNGDK